MTAAAPRDILVVTGQGGSATMSPKSSLPAVGRRVRPMRPWRELLVKFDQAAQDMGLAGMRHPDDAARTRSAYTRAKNELVKRIEAMEIAR